MVYANDLAATLCLDNLKSVHVQILDPHCTHLNHLNTGLVGYSDLHCTCKSLIFFTVFIKLSNVSRPKPPSSSFFKKRFNI